MVWLAAVLWIPVKSTFRMVPCARALAAMEQESRFVVATLFVTLTGVKFVHPAAAPAGGVQPLVVAPPRTSVQSGAPVPATVPALNTLVSVPCTAVPVTVPFRAGEEIDIPVSVPVNAAFAKVLFCRV